MFLRILVADDHAVMREGTRMVIERRPGWKVCSVAATGREAVEQANQLKPDIVVMDMTMPELNGLDAALQIKRALPATEILIFSAHDSDDLIRDAFEAGVKSVILKSEAPHFLVEAIESLAWHKPYFTAKVAQVLFSGMVNRREGTHDDQTERSQRLTPRERQVAQLLAEGKSNKEVADGLGITVRTAETHRAVVMRKLHANSVAQVVHYALRKNLIEL